jgi:hypothetical protein
VLSTRRFEPLVYGEKPENPTASGEDEWQSGGFGAAALKGFSLGKPRREASGSFT